MAAFKRIITDVFKRTGERPEPVLTVQPENTRYERHTFLIFFLHVYVFQMRFRHTIKSTNQDMPVQSTSSETTLKFGMEKQI